MGSSAGSKRRVCSKYVAGDDWYADKASSDTTFLQSVEVTFSRPSHGVCTSRRYNLTSAAALFPGMWRDITSGCHSTGMEFPLPSVTRRLFIRCTRFQIRETATACHQNADILDYLSGIQLAYDAYEEQRLPDTLTCVPRLLRSHSVVLPRGCCAREEASKPSMLQPCTRITTAKSAQDRLSVPGGVVCQQTSHNRGHWLL